METPGGSLHSFLEGPVRVHALCLPSEARPWIEALACRASEARRARADRFRFQADALRCLAAEGLLRHALAEVHGLDVDPGELVMGRHGKPSLARHPSIHFNLSHSGAWVLCALHHRPVGIDVEEARALEVLPAEQVMTNSELRHFHELPPQQAQDFFYRLWALKESLLKALGTGFSLDPRALGLHFEGDEVHAHRSGRPLGNWRLRELPMPRGAKAALCHRAG